MNELKECFLISPIGKMNSEERMNSDKLFNHIIKPVMKELGYEPTRADTIDEPGLITTQIIQKIVNSSLVIADLSGHNPNVFYELAIRHATRKPLIQIITDGELLPFDVSLSRTIFYNLSDLDNVENTKKEITKQVKTFNENNFEVDSPISTAMDLLKLKETSNPKQQELLDYMIDTARLIRREVHSMRKLR